MWINHPTDQNIDISVCPIIPTLEFNNMDHEWFPVEAFADAGIIKQEAIDIGNDVFFVGLFKMNAGKKKNIPIVRVGNIAAMPEEPIKMNTTRGVRTADAYLVEARSMGGVSGSPAFVALPAVSGHGIEEADKQNMVRLRPELEFYFMGIVQGHYDEKINTADDAADQDIVDKSVATGIVNVGIGIVVPADKILEVINQPSQVEMRRVLGEKFDNRNNATAD
jgi:hypothetical protein